jgi:hypothetical protein
MGAVVYEKNTDVPEGEYSSKFSGMDILNNGFYVLKVTDGSGNLLHQAKILKD